MEILNSDGYSKSKWKVRESRERERERDEKCDRNIFNVKLTEIISMIMNI